MLAGLGPCRRSSQVWEIMEQRDAAWDGNEGLTVVSLCCCCCCCVLRSVRRAFLLGGVRDAPRLQSSNLVAFPCAVAVLYIARCAELSWAAEFLKKQHTHKCQVELICASFNRGRWHDNGQSLIHAIEVQKKHTCFYSVYSLEPWCPILATS